MKVICIDNSEVELEFAARVLGNAGYDVHTRTNLDGIDELLVDADIVLIDFHMPGIDGGEMLSEIQKRTPEGQKLPACYLWSSDKEIGDDYKQLGFDGRIILKGNAEALVKQIDAARRIAELRRFRP